MDWNPEAVIRVMLGLKAEDTGAAAALPTVTVKRDLSMMGGIDDDGRDDDEDEDD
jgi:hypothetical protein